MAEALGRIRWLTGATTSVGTRNTDGKGGKSQPQPSQSSSKTTRRKGKGTLPRTTEAEGKGESITESPGADDKADPDLCEHCKEDVWRGDIMVWCEHCEKWLCCECQDIDKGMLEAMSKYKSLHWFCIKCETQATVQAKVKVSKELNTDQMPCVMNSILDRLDEMERKMEANGDRAGKRADTLEKKLKLTEENTGMLVKSIEKYHADTNKLAAEVPQTLTKQWTDLFEQKEKGDSGKDVTDIVKKAITEHRLHKRQTEAREQNLIIYSAEEGLAEGLKTLRRGRDRILNYFEDSALNHLGWGKLLPRISLDLGRPRLLRNQGQ